MRGQAKLKPAPSEPGIRRSEPAAIIQLNDSIRAIAKSKQHSKETQSRLQSLRDALRELRRTLAENHQLRDELAISGAQAFASPVIQDKIEEALSMLTVREREVLRLIAAGYSTKQIAGELGIAFKTAVTHRTRLMSKLDLHETASLTRFAIRHGLLQP